MFRRVLDAIMKHKVIAGVAALGVCASAVGATILLAEEPVRIPDELVSLAGGWPASFNADAYEEPAFNDDPSRTNNAFNVADFGEQGSNGWFYRYGSSLDPAKSKRLESFDGEKYSQLGQSGLEVKSNFIHTSEESSPILEWRAAEKGNVNVQLTYVKNANKDKNPSYPDGVTLYVYKGNEAIGRYEVDIKTDKEEVVEQTIENLAVEELESLYFVVDPNMNNAYDGGSLYVAINDVNTPGPKVTIDASRTDNNACLTDDFGNQGANGWTYMYGKDVKSAKLVSTQKDEEYMNVTSPNLTMSRFFIHPAINDNAIICWQPAVDGTIELRGKYTKFEQNDGDPSWPDGVTVSVYKNGEKLYSKKVKAPDSGEKEVVFREKELNVLTTDRLYFMVDADGNSSYDGGCFDLNIIDRTGATTEADVAIDETETRQNFADVKYDFGEQGKNGWFYQDGYEDDPNGCYNMSNFETEEDRYFDNSYLEIKRDFVNPGKGRSAVIKWKVAQTGDIKIDASYTKLKNEDKNPSWPDGTRVTIYHNDEVLAQQEFAADTKQEITKRLDVESVSVEKDDFITMVVNCKDNNAYDGGKYEFSIKGISPLTGKTEKDVTYSGGNRTNNANIDDDFGKQGSNGWVLQSGYYLKPSYAVNLETYKENEKYTTIDGIEIKRDYIMPANKGRSANVKWMAAKNGTVDLTVDYTKLKNEDKNPNWPDGVTVYLMKNDEVLKKEDFEPLVDKEVTKDLSVSGVKVKAGDTLTLLVDGKENTAYDGGKYHFVIEDAELLTKNMVNTSGSNYANLAMDFGAQGSNGWYYCEGKSVDKFEVLSSKTQDGTGYTSRKLRNLEVKKDFVQPRLHAHAMYKWVAGKEGDIEINGSYTKFGHADPNASWPDGVTVTVYKGDSVIYNETVSCPIGEDHSNTKNINISKLYVKAGDILTFDVGCNKNNAWDGGRLAIDIAEADGKGVCVGDAVRTNNTVLGSIESMEQGTDGWWFLEGTSPSNGKLLHFMNGDKTAYLSTQNEGLEMKKDYVHPGKDAAAIYQWVAYSDGKIDILGDYVKFGQTDQNPNYPDGVKLQIYVNNELLEEKDVAVFAGDGNDNKVDFMFTNREIHRGDKVSFIVSAKNNNGYDAGRLLVSIYEAKENTSARTNNTSLAGSFGEQGNDGWYYGMCEWNGANFEQLEYDAENNRYYNNGKPELKADFVEPGNGKNAAYKWVAAETGKIYVTGNYTKFANSADPEANGVVVRIFINGAEKRFIGVTGNFGGDVEVEIDEEYTVHAGDEIMFAVNPEGNDSWDGGRFVINISDTKIEEEPEEPEEPEEEEDDRTNDTCLKDSFGEQGKDGWYYGMCDWDGKNFEKLPYDAENNRYYNNGKPELKADFVEPGGGRNAAYKWVVAKDGTVRVVGNYTKFANSADPEANGTCLRIFLNGVEKKWIGAQGNFSEEIVRYFDETYDVKKNDEIMFAIDCDGNDAWDGGRLEVQITDVTNPPAEPQADESTSDESTSDESTSDEPTSNEPASDEATPEPAEQNETPAEEPAGENSSENN